MLVTHPSRRFFLPWSRQPQPCFCSRVLDWPDWTSRPLRFRPGSVPSMPQGSMCCAVLPAAGGAAGGGGADDTTRLTRQPPVYCAIFGWIGGVAPISEPAVWGSGLGMCCCRDAVRRRGERIRHTPRVVRFAGSTRIGTWWCTVTRMQSVFAVAVCCGAVGKTCEKVEKGQHGQ